MLTLFTNITKELTDLEKDTLVPLILEQLEYTSAERCYTGRRLCQYLKGLNFPTSEIRVRKMVNYIRVTNAARPRVLIGSGRGYFLTRDLREVDEQIESLEGRMDSMKAAIDAIKSQRLNLAHR
ncbi:MAG: hypothetical protein ACT4OJ_14185 [Bacteroidota bacterium]